MIPCLSYRAKQVGYLCWVFWKKKCLKSVWTMCGTLQVIESVTCFSLFWLLKGEAKLKKIKKNIVAMTTFFSSNSAPLITGNRFGGLNRACSRQVEETELLASSQEQCWLMCNHSLLRGKVSFVHPFYLSVQCLYFPSILFFYGFILWSTQMFPGTFLHRLTKFHYQGIFPVFVPNFDIAYFKLLFLIIPHV